MPSTPHILYSVVTSLANFINGAYYADKHFVWCATSFNQPSMVTPAIPRSSLPEEIYYELKKDVLTNDLHSARIKANRLGLLNGAVHKLAAGAISTTQKAEIDYIVASATNSDFYPLLYVIPYKPVKRMVTIVPPGSRASLTSPEYQIVDLPGRYFDVIRLV